MSTSTQVSKEWLAGLLPRGGYANVRFATRDPEVVMADHPARPNITLRVRRELDLITITHAWQMKKPGWGKGKDVLVALNEANSMSWRDTFAQDKDGDLLVSSYVSLTEGLSEGDVLGHLEKEAQAFRDMLNVCDLGKWIA